MGAGGGCSLADEVLRVSGILAQESTAKDGGSYVFPVLGHQDRNHGGGEQLGSFELSRDDMLHLIGLLNSSEVDIAKRELGVLLNRLDRSAVEGLTQRLFEALRNRSSELAALDAEGSTGARPTPRKTQQQGARQLRQPRNRDLGLGIGSTPPLAHSSDDRCTPRTGTVASCRDGSLSARTLHPEHRGRLGGSRARSAHSLGVHTLSTCRFCCGRGVDLTGQQCTCEAGKPGLSGPSPRGRTPPPSEPVAEVAPTQSMPQVFRRLTAPHNDENAGEADTAATPQASAYLEALLEAHELATGQPATSSRKVYCEESDPSSRRSPRVPEEKAKEIFDRLYKSGKEHRVRRKVYHELGLLVEQVRDSQNCPFEPQLLQRSAGNSMGTHVCDRLYRDGLERHRRKQEIAQMVKNTPAFPFRPRTSIPRDPRDNQSFDELGGNELDMSGPVEAGSYRDPGLRLFREHEERKARQHRRQEVEADWRKHSYRPNISTSQASGPQIMKTHSQMDFSPGFLNDASRLEALPDEQLEEVDEDVGPAVETHHASNHMPEAPLGTVGSLASSVGGSSLAAVAAATSGSAVALDEALEEEQDMDEAHTLEECSHATKEVLQLLHPCADGNPSQARRRSPLRGNGPSSVRADCVSVTEGYLLSPVSSYEPDRQSERPHCSAGFAHPSVEEHGGAASNCSAHEGATVTVDRASSHSSSSSSNGSFGGLSTHSATPHMSRGSTVALTCDPRSTESGGATGAYTPCTGPPSHGSSPVPTTQVDLASHGQPVGLGSGAYDVSRQVSCVTFHSHCVTTPSGSPPKRIFSGRIPSEVELLREVSVQFQAAAACGGAMSPAAGGAGPPPPPAGNFTGKVMVHPRSPSGERIKSASFPAPAQQSHDLRHSSSRPGSPRAPAEPQAVPPQDAGMSNGRRKSGGHCSPALPIQQPSRPNLATSSVQVVPPLDGLRSPRVPVGPAGSFPMVQQQHRMPHMMTGASGTNGTASPTGALLVAPPRCMQASQALHTASQPALGQGPGMSTPRMLPVVQPAHGQLAQSMSMVMLGTSQGLQPTASAPKLMSVPGSPRVPEHRAVLGHVPVMQHGGHANATLSPASVPPFRQALVDEQATGSAVAMHGATGAMHRWNGPASSAASRDVEGCMCSGLASK